MSLDSVTLRYTDRRIMARVEAAPIVTPVWGIGDEWANTLTHGAGLALGILACGLLLGRAGG